MAKIIRFPVERTTRGCVLTVPGMPIVWLPLAMSGYFWLSSADALLECWWLASGIPAPRRRPTRRAPVHRK